MRSSIRSRLAAITVFLLIAVVVVGGMAWATASTFQLRKRGITDQHERRISRALSEMDSYMSAVLYKETARSHKDYRAFRTERPKEVWSSHGVELSADQVTILSDLVMSGPHESWIDLHFQINQYGEPYSPQMDEEAAAWAIENIRSPVGVWPRAQESWEWLQIALPGIDLRACVAEGLHDHRGPFIASETSEADMATATMDPAVVYASGQAQISSELQQRKRRLRDLQMKYLPQPACVDPQIADMPIASRSSSITERIDPAISQRGDGGVEIRLDPFVSFWLGDGMGDERKLAFVREVHADATVFYQGFIGDWNLLAPELLGAAGDLPDGSQLRPTNDTMEHSPEALEYEMANLPVRLEVPGIPGGAASAAWREIRGTLITSWLAAAAVLVVAGTGLKNLVALTERRMQFAYAVTHELRTPLTTFRLYTDMLSAGLVPDSKKQEYLETLNRESQRLSSLVEDVLEYARLESHKVKLNPAETDGPALLSVIAETLQKRCHDNGIEARTEDAMLNGARVSTDVDLVNRIATVLVNNACRHARGRDDAAVLVRVSNEDDRVHLDVIDTGPGVDRHDAHQIFKPFRRGHGADAAAYGGIGLGLALARSWAELLGGKLELAARHDPKYGGAHFRLTIPARIEA